MALAMAFHAVTREPLPELDAEGERLRRLVEASLERMRSTDTEAVPETIH